MRPNPASDALCGFRYGSCKCRQLPDGLAVSPTMDDMSQTHRRVLLAKPRGYCAGVDRAVQAVEIALGRFGAPVYVRKQIVHNKHVVSELEKLGAIFVEETDEVPEGSVIVFSAHGIAPEVRESAKARGLTEIGRAHV